VKSLMQKLPLKAISIAEGAMARFTWPARKNKNKTLELLYHFPLPCISLIVCTSRSNMRQEKVPNLPPNNQEDDAQCRYHTYLAGKELSLGMNRKLSSHPSYIVARIADQSCSHAAHLTSTSTNQSHPWILQKLWHYQTNGIGTTGSAQTTRLK
jgi:hypothetical protein